MTKTPNARTATSKPGKPPRTRKQKVLRVVKWASVAGIIGLIGLVAAFVVLYRTIDIPNPNEDFQTETSFIYYADGSTELGRFATQNRDSIPLSEMPQHLQDAVVAAENRTFWSDSGIDPRGIVRAAFSNAKGGSSQGASTITQQYVKILYLTSERTYTRKIKEAVLSLKLQRQQSKKEILEGYLNTIYFGRGAYGVQAAAQAYFDKPASELSLRESAVLARVLNNPSRYDPAKGADARRSLKAGYERVLAGMAEMGTIEPAAAEQAAKRLPKFPKVKAESTYGGQRGHMLTLVKKELQRLGFTEEEIDGQGLRVTTTLQQPAMKAAEEAVVEARPEGFGDKELHVGVASVEPGTGALRGFYGGQDYLDSQINWSVAGGQAGSTMKAFAVAAAIKQGFSLKDTFEGNSPIEIGDTSFRNQGDRDYGSAVNMLKATASSINTAFIDMTDAMDNGPQKVMEMAQDMGLPPSEAKGPKAPGFPNRSPGLEPMLGVSLGSATVSPINMAGAYATIANGGVAAETYLIESVESAEGEVLYDHKVKTERVLDEDIAADVSYALEQVTSTSDGSGAAAGAALGRPSAGKTGTSTNDDDDVVSSWFVGFTPQYSSAVVYVRGKGNDPLDGWLPSFYGGDYPADTWAALMVRLHEGLEVEDLPDPVYVDGEAPSEGHAPYTPAPSPTRKPSPSKDPSPTKEPTKDPTKEPTTEAPTPTETPTAEPTDEPEPTPTDPTVPTPSLPTGTPSAGGGGGGGAGAPGRGPEPGRE